MALFHRPLPRTLEASLRDLEESNKLVRRSAVHDLARHSREEATEEIVSALLKALRDEDPLVRTEAAYSLGDARARDALPALLAAVDDRASMVRQAAIDALGLIGDSRATGRLLRAIDDERPDVRFQAVIALGRVSPTEGLEGVIRAGRDEDYHVRYIAVRVAEELSRDPARDPGATLDLDPRIRNEAESWLKDDDTHVRLAAAILLARAGSDAGADMLLDVIEDLIQPVEPEDEAAAIELAATLDLREAIPGLEKRAFGLKRLVQERHTWGARVALARMGHKRARTSIIRDLRAWSRDRRTAAATAAGHAGLVEAREQLERMRGNAELAEQDAVEEALALLQDRGGAP